METKKRRKKKERDENLSMKSKRIMVDTEI